MKRIVRVSLLVLVIAVIPLVLSTSRVFAATYYVAGDVGDDARTSVQAQSTSTPWKTIQKAADTMVAGDTVNVRGGITYTEKVVPANSGSSGNYITYQAWDGTGLPIIDATGETDAFNAQMKTYLKIHGFILKNGSVRGAYITSNTYFYNNIVENSYQGVNIFGAATNTYIYNNTVISNVISGINAGTGFGSYNRVIENNIIANNGLGLSSDSGFMTFVHDYNLYYNNTGFPGYPEIGTDYLTVNGIVAAPHDIHANPLFTALEDYNFTLQETSPAINSGADRTASGVTTDILGRARPNAGAFDIGAYEDPNLYVDGNDGSDTSNGSMGAPFKTIQKGADVATAGDNVNVKGGITYNATTCSNGIVCPANSGTFSNHITYRAWLETGIPVINAAGHSRGFYLDLKDYIRIDGFEVKNGTSQAAIYNYFGEGVSITNNLVHNSSFGIYSDGSSMTTNTILNNTIVDNSYYAIRTGSSVGMVIRNNIIANNSTGISNDGQYFVDHDYDLFYNNSVKNYTTVNGMVAGPHDLIVDPLPIDPTNNNFRLQKSSPARNAGADLSAYGITTDILGVSRPQGASYDIGAYEYYDVSVSLDVVDSSTNDATPTLSGDADTISGETISSVAYSVDGGDWTTSGVSGTSSFSLIPAALADGEHAIRVKATDSLGTATDSTMYASRTFTVDTNAPTGTVVISSGATLTKTKEVTLTLTSADSAQMKISSAADFDGASWETYSATKAHTLTTGDGLKTVYVKFKDEAGNQSETYSATITLDTKKPTTKITELGLITDIPDKTPLFYYFTSQTPRIKGTTEALSTVHFEYGEEDYTTTADAEGKYEITLSELPRELVELTYYAVDPAGNQGTDRILRLMIGVENFPAELLPQDETTTETEEVTPTESETTPTPSETPTETIKVFGIEIIDQNGNPLTETAVYIDGQKYVTDKNGKIYIEKQPTEEMELEVEINGRRVKGTVMGENIVAEVSAETSKKTVSWYWWVLLLAVGVAGYSLIRRKGR